MSAIETIPATTLASLQVGRVEFDSPEFLILIPVLSVLAAWLGRRSLAGLGPVTRWVALGVRLVVIALIAAALAEPQWRTESKDVSVTVVMDVSQSVPAETQRQTEQYIERAVATNKTKPDDLVGVVTVGKDSFVQALPSKLTTQVERHHVGSVDGTNLSAGLKLAMAVMRQDAANRAVLASDGNETAGNLLQAAEAAKAAKIPIDVLPLRYKYAGEVINDRLIAPATARYGENISLRIALNATRPTRGRISILMDNQPIDLDPDSPSTSVPVELKEGPNYLTQTIKPPRDGPVEFKAVFEPELLNGRPINDAVVENNSSTAVTFVVGEAKVLVVADSPELSEAILSVFGETKIVADVRSGEAFPASLAELARYDAVIMIDQSAHHYSQKQQEDIVKYVHEIGGGLVMVGGPNAFGAGGWIGSPVEEALPIRLDPPQKRQMPRGALALVIHSVEIPEGVYYGKKVCEAAVNSLSREDYVGIHEYNWNNGSDWTVPMQKVGDGSNVKRAIQKLTFGDMPDFGPSVQQAYDALVKTDAGQRHVIIISDGDPSPPSKALLKKYVDAKITISTVGVATHNAGDVGKMKSFAEFTGGRHYEVPAGQLAQLPQIFIKEAQTVKRSLIWEGTPFSPAVVGGMAETMRGISSVPAIGGYVVAADREGLSQVILRGKESDPILAMWQHGLGKVVTFTSEASTRWAGSWLSWSGFRSFWEQHVRWAMRPSGSPNVRLLTEQQGDQTLVTIEALDTKGEPMNFANFRGRLSGPSGSAKDIDMRQIGPGRYQATVPTADSGAYLTYFQYTAPGSEEGQVARGSVQAAIIRPFADEFRQLEDNEPLLKQIAAMTGGRVLSGDPVRDDLWTREGLTMPVSTRPIWLFFAIIGIGLFVVDVGVRRVRVEPAMIIAAVRRAISPSKSKAGEQMGGLRAAREGARAAMAKRAVADAESAKSVEAARAVEAAKSVKFEAQPQKLSKPAQVQLEKPGEASSAKVQAQGPANAVSRAKPTDPGDLSALLKAKKRARSEMDDGPGSS